MDKKTIEEIKRLNADLAAGIKELDQIVVTVGIEAYKEGYAAAQGGTLSGKFGPKAHDHPSVGRECPACQVPLAEGDFTCLVALGPGDDPEARERRLAARPYNAVCAEVHWACATGEED